MELLYLILILIVVYNTFFKLSFGRPTDNFTATFNLNMGKDVQPPDGADYDDYEDTFASLIKNRDDNILDSILPPDLGISKETVKIQSDYKNPAPEYMMELYKKFSQNKLNYPSSNIVRSFNNINTKDSEIPFSKNIPKTVVPTRVHTMIFNITSISPDETIDLAELRLYTLVEKDRNTYIGVDRKVSCLEVLPNSKERYRLIESKHIYGRHSGWETFDVTSVVRHWITQANAIQILEIRIESVVHSVSMGDMDININNQNKNEPLLIVFSSDTKVKGLHIAERHELVTREMNSIDIVESPKDTLLNSSTHVHTLHNNINNSVEQSSSSNNQILSRVKRRGRRNIVCHRRPMYVSFRDINWDTWIIAPHGYQAFQCVGRCYFPVSDHLSPTKYAIIRGLLHSAYPGDYTRPCCVPTKLDPISILYIDEQGVPTYKYRYDGMVVAECGCR